MEHRIECTNTEQTTCDGCANAGDETPADVCVADPDDGSSMHYCQGCYDTMLADEADRKLHDQDFVDWNSQPED